MYYFKGKKECDFLIKEGTRISSAIQVVYDLTKENINREVEGLIEAIKEYNLKKGLLIVFNSDIESVELPSNIEMKYVWKWLLE